MNEKTKLVEKSKLLEPIIRIGKSGLTPGAISEIKIQLKKSRLIKVKLLKNSMEKKDKKTMAKELAEATDSELIHQVGFVVVLHKK